MLVLQNMKNAAKTKQKQESGVLGNFKRQKVRMSSKLTVVTISHYISVKSHVLFKEARSSVKNNRVTAQRNTLQWPPMLLGMKSNNGQ